MGGWAGRVLISVSKGLIHPKFNVLKFRVFGRHSVYVMFIN